jgi:peptidoglycan/xylan/chitin deacetylase (PgdA/CDA1 family)
MKRKSKALSAAGAGRRAGYRQALKLALPTALFLVVLLVLQGCSAGVTESQEDSGSKPEAQQETQGRTGESGGTQEEEKSQPQSQQVPPFDPDKPIVIRRGNPDRKMVTLTIDDGWNRDDRILDLLESYDIKCTVFPIGGRGVAEANPEWIRRMDRDGFEVCTHTYSHYKLTDHPQEWIAADIRKGQDVIAAVTGKRYPYMRPPGGFLNEAVERAAAENGCYVVMWSNELGDTNPNITADGEVSAVLSRLSNGDIILCHFGGYHTYDALKRLIPEIQNRGYRFVTLTELL